MPDPNQKLNDAQRRAYAELITRYAEEVGRELYPSGPLFGVFANVFARHMPEVLRRAKLDPEWNAIMEQEQK